jgi:hypothetical protein
MVSHLEDIRPELGPVAVEELLLDGAGRCRWILSRA